MIKKCNKFKYTFHVFIFKNYAFSSLHLVEKTCESIVCRRTLITKFDQKKARNEI